MRILQAVPPVRNPARRTGPQSARNRPPATKSRRIAGELAPDRPAIQTRDRPMWGQPPIIAAHGIRPGIERVSRRRCPTAPGSGPDGCRRAAGHPRLARLLAEARWIVGALLRRGVAGRAADLQPRRSGIYPLGRRRQRSTTSGGRLGAWVADVILLLFGLSAYLVALGMLVTVARGFRRLHRRRSAPIRSPTTCRPGRMVSASLLLIAGATGLEALRLYNAEGRAAGRAGRHPRQCDRIAALKAGIGFTGASVIFLVGHRDRLVVVPRLLLACGRRAGRHFHRGILAARRTAPRGGRRPRDR